MHVFYTIVPGPGPARGTGKTAASGRWTVLGLLPASLFFSSNREFALTEVLASQHCANSASRRHPELPCPTPCSLSGSHGRKGAGAQAERVQPIVPMGPHPPATALSVCRRCRGARAGYKNQIWADRPFLQRLAQSVPLYCLANDGD